MLKFFSVLLALIMVVGAPSIAGEAPKTFKTADNKSIDLTKLQGKVVVVNFWATWCGPCRAEIPGMLEVYNKYKAKGLEIIGVALDRGGWTVVKPFVEKNNITYPIFIGDDQAVNAFGGFDAIPQTFFIDKKGNLLGKQTGSMTKEAFEEAIKKAL